MVAMIEIVRFTIIGIERMENHYVSYVGLFLKRFNRLWFFIRDLNFKEAPWLVETTRKFYDSSETSLLETIKAVKEEVCRNVNSGCGKVIS